ncbi:MAG: 30S ribosomal protein S17 [Pseudomonadota bacterium]
MAEARRRLRQVLQGIVRKNKMDKTVVVEVMHRVRHEQYKKYLSRRVRYKAHDEKNECQVGDTVQIVSSRPLSKEKRWRVQRLVERAE